MTKNQPRIGKWCIASDIITSTVQTNTISIRRRIPAKLRTIYHDCFRILGFAFADHPHIAGRWIPRQTIGTTLCKLCSNSFPVLPCC
ncbi:Uncharacterised protein [Shigella sonnei]|nr:Uncharacterised protein [Shigella sonnei]